VEPSNDTDFSKTEDKSIRKTHLIGSDSYDQAAINQVIDGFEETNSQQETIEIEN
jgi:hypothetical protein